MNDQSLLRKRSREGEIYDTHTLKPNACENNASMPNDDDQLSSTFCSNSSSTSSSSSSSSSSMSSSTLGLHANISCRSLLDVLSISDLASFLIQFLRPFCITRLPRCCRALSVLPFQWRFAVWHEVDLYQFCLTMHLFEQRYDAGIQTISQSSPLLAGFPLSQLPATILSQCSSIIASPSSSSSSSGPEIFIHPGTEQKSQAVIESQQSKLHFYPHGKHCLRTLRLVAFHHAEPGELRYIRSRLMHYDLIQSLSVIRVNFHSSKLAVAHLPRALKRLKFLSGIAELIPAAFPSSLESLHLDNMMDKLDQFPQTLRSLTLFYCDLPLLQTKPLPPYLEELDMGGSSFDFVRFPQYLPASLRVLKIASYFNKPLQAGCFPPMLEKLDLGAVYNYPIEVGVLPASLRSLKLSGEFKHKLLPGVLPTYLEELHLGQDYIHRLEIGILPPALRKLTLSFDYDHHFAAAVLPSSLERLQYGSGFNRSLSSTVFPCSLQSLIFSRKFNQRLLINQLPSALTELHLGDFYNHAFAVGVLPPTLLSLTLHNRRYAHRFPPFVLPSSLRNLMLFSECFPAKCLSEPGVLPASLFSLGLSVPTLPDGGISLHKLDPASPISVLIREPNLLPSSLPELRLVCPPVEQSPVKTYCFSRNWIAPIHRAHPALRICCFRDNATLENEMPVDFDAKDSTTSG